VLSLGAVDVAYAEAAARAGVVVEQLAPGSAARRVVRTVWSLRHAISTGRYTVVQANGAGTLKYLVLARRLGGGSCPLVYRAIGVGSYWRRGRARVTAYRWLLHQADRIVAVCEAVAADLLKAAAADPRRLTVIPNGVEAARVASTPHARERVRAALGVGPHDCLLVTVGSLTPEKNPGALVELVAACRRQGLPVRGLLVGEGRLLDALHVAIARARLDGTVRIMPPRSDLGACLAAADLFVLPSLTEGMPAALIEAGLAGLPAVAYDVGGVAEVVDDGVTGVLVRAGDAAELVQATASLVGAPARRAAMGQAARQAYRRFEITRVASAYQAVYQQLVDAARERTGASRQWGRSGHVGGEAWR
jgi:glycosyltransferase involved in cell wall biosynthesis